MKEKIAVLMGGRSLEREVSLRSGRRVTEALAEAGYRVVPLDVTPDLVATLRSEKPDAVYVALHGKDGEDGTIQELLEFLGIRYTGPGVVASALAWDKALSKRLFGRDGIPTPPWVAFTAASFKHMGAATALDLVSDAVGGFPLVVKPASQGSALGLTKVTSEDGLPSALLDALSYGDTVLVERWIDGTEIAVSVIDGDGGPEVLPPVEMVPRSGVFDFSAMYTPGETDYYVPARLPEETLASVRSLARRVHELLGCRHVSRVDMVVDEDGAPFVLECNTSPGMTETSLLPMAAQAAGLGFQDLVERLVRMALDAVE
ncbi:D-alanine--D-alanine ligase [Coriobacteriia bacterium Es71-Z0120]|uniref:D-alanine--D-alanine ligase family protein n=1 Tax=Parvivirga hydrogeniphila TaxID=2939460 RepID=UPI002260A9CA|nr:D-alanine--D-alanine ligase [Parvivirga hydrogeniphila]MCL4078235.1 D-alanine--D-alanine ligase [Parvivirga hydrogeniphila]